MRIDMGGSESGQESIRAGWADVAAPGSVVRYLRAMLLLLFACAAGPVGDDGAVGGATDTSPGDSGGNAEADLHGEWAAERLEAPEFAATNRDGAARSRGDLVDGPTVMWFYPAAGTYG
jgi:hypothetical protein